MIKREVHKIKALIIFLLFLVAVGGANIALGMVSNRVVPVLAGLFFTVVSSWCVMRNIRTIERYAAMEVKEEQIFNGLD